MKNVLHCEPLGEERLTIIASTDHLALHRRQRRQHLPPRRFLSRIAAKLREGLGAACDVWRRKLCCLYTPA